ncbi:hypothetical protein [Rhizobium sp. AG207R]|uniref:hypothetical protein n=1 Tax=Rhizobium sp. AG207R TaxID=2802287 RepID=UPI0022AC87AC|nr:hypothetical protein [Rhizobium sp. AG207R]MCZ3377411.1 hypothetical protein [Rhizobium sp. AG207R]
MFSSCSLTDRLEKASSAKGVIAAGTNLPPLPDDCRKKEPHASIRVGDELRSVVVRERGALDRANARVGRCEAFYDGTRANFERHP